MTEEPLRKELSEVRDRLSRIEALLLERCEARCQRIKQAEDDIETLFNKVNKLGDKINTLNVTMAKWAGAAAMAGALLTWVLRGLGIEQ